MLLGVFLLSIPVFYGQEVPKFSSEAEKAAWIQTHPKEYEQISGTNVEAPQFTTEKEKETWIKENPGAYLHHGGTADRIPEFKTQEEKDAYFRKLEGRPENIHEKALSSKPTPTTEGGTIVDEKNYNERKQQWIDANSSTYDRITKQ